MTIRKVGRSITVRKACVGWLVLTLVVTCASGVTNVKASHVFGRLQIRVNGVTIRPVQRNLYVIDAGRVDPSKEQGVDARFDIINGTATPVVVTWIAPSCMCTSAEVAISKTHTEVFDSNSVRSTTTPFVIAPSESIPIKMHVQFDDGAPGTFSKNLLFSTSPSTSPPLEVKLDYQVMYATGSK